MMNDEDLAAKELDAFLTAKQAGQGAPPLRQVARDYVALAEDLTLMAETIRLPAALVQVVESRLQQVEEVRVLSQSLWDRLVSFTLAKFPAIPKDRRATHILAAVLILCLLVTAPLLAAAILEHFAPHEVHNLPPVSVTYAPTPAKPRVEDFTEIAKLAGFTPLVPRYQPTGCKLQEHFYLAEPKEVLLVYSCMDIAEHKAESMQRPFVGEGAIETVTVGGQPALYVNGAWVKVNGQDEPKWMPGVAHELLFERNGISIRIDASTADLTKEQLIQIAESME